MDSPQTSEGYVNAIRETHAREHFTKYIAILLHHFTPNFISVIANLGFSVTYDELTEV